MKMKIVLMLVAVGLMAGIAQANMLPNPGFEAGNFAVNHMPDGWTHSSIAWTSAHTWMDDGSNKYMQMLPWTSGAWDAYIYTVPDVSVTAGVEYSFSIWAKNPDSAVSNEINAWVGWTDSAGNYSEVKTGIGTVTGTDWAQFDLGSVIAPVDTVAARAWFGVASANGTRAVHLDDASMVPEPVTLSLLGLGVRMLRRRRKA